MQGNSNHQQAATSINEDKSPRPRVSASPRLVSLRKWRNAILGTLLVLAGLLTALVTVYASRVDDVRLAGVAAIASLVIVLLIIVLVLPPLARSARSEITRLDLPLEITKGGIVFLGILFLVAFAAWNTGNNLLFLVFSLLASTLFVSWVAARASLRDLTVSARFPDHIFAGEPAPVIIMLRNRKRILPSCSILVEARGPVDSDEKRRRKVRFRKRTLAYFTYVPHKVVAEQRVEQLFKRRGHVLITGFELSTAFPFGFFRRRRRLRARDVDILVYPKPLPASDDLHLLPINAGRLASLRRGAGHDLLSLRDYQPQDDLRHIDWKSTARARRLIVREFTAEDERRVTIALDTRIPENSDAKEFKIKFERGVVLAASLVAHFIKERAEVRLLLGEERGRYGTEQEQLYSCLRRLALVQPNGNSPKVRDSEAEQPFESSEEFTPAGEGNYVILLTAAERGTIPSQVWRTSHVIYL
ncbi:MAG: hypothetical protein AUG51_12300 [Acidobacteria bacterium 13_1_20CM_3_53_8]|nr:MAG: hypothetical protein AUG51_12300 [Acidobacteria bacterium 13_1_20CM_3_53_8]